MADDVGSLAAKADHLFRTVRPGDGGEHSFEEVAAAIRAVGGPTISAPPGRHRHPPDRTHPDAAELAERLGTTRP